VAARPQGGSKERGVTQTQDKPRVQEGKRRKIKRVSIIVFVVLLLAAVIPAILIAQANRSAVSHQPIHYIGVYERGNPPSYANVNAFKTTVGITPNIIMYYSSWQEPFEADFATAAAHHGAVTLVQMDPTGISLAAIAAGQYDGYLRSYANAVSAYRRPVILSFGHEMNGHWYSWGYTRASAAAFVAAWRHIVTLFRSLNVQNVTWMWTVNIIQSAGRIPNPAPWWPGKSYVNWVGIDGYYSASSSTFPALFGSTITAVREMTGDPILIAETAVHSGLDQPAKIADLLAGIRLYGLLGFVWFEVDNWRIDSSAAGAAFRQAADGYRGSPS
jgi:hypothetical protein